MAFINPAEIDPEVTRLIHEKLSHIEQTNGVRIIYACESGSRAWGFASPDSDYDVRFIYVRPREWYLAFDVEKQRDVLECEIVDDIDCNGWDLRKALYLFTRTNGALLEWLNSPIRYLEKGSFATEMRRLAPGAFHPTALCYHYSHMARHNAREHLFQEKVRLKKYFYVLRPLLAIRHIQDKSGIPPVAFEKLVSINAPDRLKPEIEKLLELKRTTPEIGVGAPIKAIGDFVQTELDKHGASFKGQNRPQQDSQTSLREKLNNLFRATIEEAFPYGEG